MEELFITKIHIHEVRHLKDVVIPLSETERKHLILTGRNGSGKTSVLEALNNSLSNTMPVFQVDLLLVSLEKLQRAYVDQLRTANPLELSQIEKDIESARKKIPGFDNLQFTFNLPLSEIYETVRLRQYFFCYFKARRVPRFDVPKGFFEKIDYHGNGKYFIQYLANLKAEEAFAQNEDDERKAGEIKRWFVNLESSLRELFNNPLLELRFVRSDRNFYIIESGKQPYDLNQLADGYSAIIEILASLIMQMEMQKTVDFNAQGTVLIDEIETHLHIDLQKKVMPFLVNFFPRIQFIVTTHSPFVLGSVGNAVICDLEKGIVTNDLSGYSSEMIVESYFGMDKYSDLLKAQVDEYEHLMSKLEPTLEEEDRMEELAGYFETLPKYLADELTVKLQQIRLKSLKPQR